MLGEYLIFTQHFVVRYYFLNILSFPAYTYNAEVTAYSLDLIYNLESLVFSCYSIMLAPENKTENEEFNR